MNSIAFFIIWLSVWKLLFTIDIEWTPNNEELVGEWMLEDSWELFDKIPKITINQDGTCLVEHLPIDINYHGERYLVVNRSTFGNEIFINGDEYNFSGYWFFRTDSFVIESHKYRLMMSPSRRLIEGISQGLRPYEIEEDINLKYMLNLYVYADRYLIFFPPVRVKCLRGASSPPYGDTPFEFLKTR